MDMILAAGKPHVDGLNVAEVVALQNALLDQSLENSPAPAAVDAEFVGQGHYRLRHAGRRINIVAHTSFVWSQRLLGFYRPEPEQVHSGSSVSCAARWRR